MLFRTPFEIHGKAEYSISVAQHTLLVSPHAYRSNRLMIFNTSPLEGLRPLAEGQIFDDLAMAKYETSSGKPLARSKT